MKKKLLVSVALTSVLLLSSCGWAEERPMTEAQQAEKYWMSVWEFKEQKEAAARMNMTVEDHLKMWHWWEKMDHSNMDMSDDSAMIEDDADAKSWTHVMDDGTTMTDDDMHMETMHKDWDAVEKHSADKHGDHE